MRVWLLPTSPLDITGGSNNQTEEAAILESSASHQTYRPSISAAIEETIALLLMLALNLAGWGGPLTLGILAVVILLRFLRRPRFMPLLHELGLERIAWRHDQYARFQAAYDAYVAGVDIDRNTPVGKVKWYRRRFDVLLNRWMSGAAFCLAAVPFPTAIPGGIALLIVVIALFDTGRKWLAVQRFMELASQAAR